MIGSACSFCATSRREVGKLIAGPGVSICDVCVGLCDDILDQRGEGAGGEELCVQFSLREPERCERCGVARTESGQPICNNHVGGRLCMGRWVRGAVQREPTVSEVDLVANLRAACKDPLRTVATQYGVAVILPVDLVLAIADGIEASGRAFDVDDFQPDELGRITTQVSKDIVKLVVERLFGPAKTEGEKALEACEALGLTEAQVGAMLSSAGLGWPSTTLGLGLAGIIPLIYSMLLRPRVQAAEAAKDG